MTLLMVVLVCVPILPSSQAGRSWDTLEDDAPAAVRGIAFAGSTGFAVGDGGLLLQRLGDTWVPLASPTDLDLHAVTMRSATHGLAVGADGIVLDYRHRWAEAPGHPDGVEVAAGSTTQPGATSRHVEWSIPRNLVGMGPGDTIGLGLRIDAGSTTRHHPAPFDTERPSTTEAIVWDDIPFGNATIDGKRDAAWNDAVHAEDPGGDVPYTLYLMRDHDRLYAMAETTAPLDGVLLQTHKSHGAVLGANDLRAERTGTIEVVPELRHARRGAADWDVQSPPGTAPGSGSLLDVAYLDAATPIMVGENGRVLTQGTTGYVLRTLTGFPVLRGVDSDAAGRAWIVGSDSTGASNAGMWRYDDGQLDPIVVPSGSYGLHDIDLAACVAVGSHGTILTCDGSMDLWSRQSLGNQLTLRSVLQEPSGGQRVWAAGASGSAASVYRYDGESWASRSPPSGTAPLTSVSFGAGGPLVGSEVGELLVYRMHAPTFTSLPTSTTTRQGEQGIVPIVTDDGDNDLVKVHMDPPPEMMEFPEPPTIHEIDPGRFEIRYRPDFDDVGTFTIDLRLSDGDHSVPGNTTVVIDDVNAPPVWDPHDDDIIPHSVAYTTMVHATDPDGDPLTLYHTALPPGATFTDLGGGDGRIDWTPTFGDIGTHPVQLIADDGLLSDVLDFDIIVPDDEPPVIGHINGPRGLCAAGPYHTGLAPYSIVAHDPEGGTLNVTWTFSDDNSTQYGPAVSHVFDTPGMFVVNVTVRDPVGLTTSAQLTVKVEDCIHVEYEPDRPCYNIFDQVSGIIRLYNHTGHGANGTFRAQAWYHPLVGPDGAHTITGTITNGIGVLVVPFDMQPPLPLNHLGMHELYITATMPDTINGNDETDTTRGDYEVVLDCKVDKQIPD